MFDSSVLSMIGYGLLETLYMTLVSTFIAYLIGLPLGIILTLTGKEGITPNLVVYKALDFVINILRSVPFLILLLFIIPFTRWVVGTSIGSSATIVPLTIAAAPFIARLVEASLKEVDYGVIEASCSMGASPFQIVYKVLLPEALPSLIVQGAIATTTILGYSAMAGIVGGGGLGAISINYGYYRYQNDIMLLTVIVLVVVVQVIQGLGMNIAGGKDKRK